MSRAKGLSLFTVLFCSIWASASAPVFIQANAANSGNSIPFTSSNGAGHSLFLILGMFGGVGYPAITSVTDSQHNNWVPLGSTPIVRTSLNGSSTVWMVENCAAGANTVTFTSLSDTENAAVLEYSGIPSAYALETISIAAVSGTSLTPGVVTSTANDLLLAYGFNTSNSSTAGTFTTPSGYTSRASSLNTGQTSLQVWDNSSTTAGAYSTTITASQSPASGLHGGLIVIRSVLPTFGWLQGAIGSTTGSTSAAATFNDNAQANDLLVASVSNRNGAIPSSVSGCGATWNLAVTTNAGVYADMSVYYAMAVPAGSCTVTASFSASQEINITVSEYKGPAATYAVEIYETGGRSGSPVSASLTTFGTNDVVYSVVNEENQNQGNCSASTTFSQSAGFAARSYLSNCGGYSATAVFDTAGGPGSYTNSVTVNNGSSNDTEVIIAFRSVLPAFGRLQCTQFTSSASQAYPLNNVAGDLLIALGCLPSGPPSDTAGNSWITGPGIMESDFGHLYYIFYAINAKGGANTVTMPGSTCGLELWEYRGLAIGSPIAGSSAFFSDSGSSTINAGPVPIFSPGVIFSIVGALGNSSGTITYTGGSGFIPVTYSATDNVQMWDQNVTSGSYSNPVTASGNMSYQNALTLALSTVNVTYPVLRQHARGSAAIGADGSNSAVLLSPVVKGDILFALEANQSGYTPGTTSDTMGNTWALLEGGGSNVYGIWWAIAKASGIDTITNTNSNCVAGVEFFGANSATLDQRNSGSSSSSTVNTGSITTSQANELVVSTGFAIDATNRLLYSGMDAGWSGLVFSCGGHYASAWLGYQTKAAQGSYSNTFTWAGSGVLNAAIMSFETAPWPGAAATPLTILTELMEQETSIPGVQ
jgi:hypothetical protein